METLFIAYNDETDSTRANHVRKQLLATERFLVEGYCPYTSLSKTRHGAGIQDLKQQFDKQLAASVAAVLLLGEDCATNPWIRYAIEQCYVHDMPFFGLDISMIPDEYGHTSKPDINPLERFAVLEGGQKIYLDCRYRTYQWKPTFDDSITDYLIAAKNNAALSQRAKNNRPATHTKNYRNYESMRSLSEAV